MLKRYVAILLLTIASAVLVGHNLIPHHHHHLAHEATSHHHHHGEEDGSEDHGLKALADLFANMLHDGADVSFAGNDVPTIQAKKLFVLVALLPDYVLSAIIPLPPILRIPVFNEPSTGKLYSCAETLRGPPALMA